MTGAPTEWTSDDVPSPPYYHGTRAELQPGDELTPGDVGNAPYDGRQMYWATTDLDTALRWALQRKVHLGPTLYVYEVELDGPEVDTNMHRVRTPDEAPTSIMAPSGRVIRLVQRVDQAEIPNVKPMHMWPPDD